MMQYLVDIDQLQREEAIALLAGIVLDTKGFTINTSSGTFDTAAYLKRAGADASEVKRLLQSDIQITTAKFELLRTATLYKEGIALAYCDSQQSRISIAQAADELLSIKGVNTSFAVAKDRETVYVSGRSIGSINVQVILEMLGGGGSQSTAGLQVKGKTVEKVVTELKQAIDVYLKKNK